VRRSHDELLFVQRAVEPARGLWTLPGGFVEVGETTDEAALRELAEETGLTGRGTRLIGANTQLSRLSGAVVVMAYLVDEWEGEPVAATDAMALDFFPRDGRPPIAFQAHRELLALYDALSLEIG
jgi:ADP-ribose pyrophosphatase YjhB (NUDIX family)